LITRKRKVIPYPMFNSVDKFAVMEFYPTKENGLEWFADWDDHRTVHPN
jgi:hypothetical protein